MSAPHQPDPPFADLVPHFTPLAPMEDTTPVQPGWWERLGRRGQSGVLTLAVVAMAGGVYWSSQGEAAPPPVKPQVLETVIVNSPPQINASGPKEKREILYRAKKDVPLDTKITMANVSEYFESYESVPGQWPTRVDDLKSLDRVYAVKPIQAKMTITKDMFGEDPVGKPPVIADRTFDREYHTPEGLKIYRYKFLPNGDTEYLGEVDPSTRKLFVRR
jgi:hypothetical protein